MADILFVDDEQHILNSLKRSFRDFDGVVCHFATCPIEALDIIAEKDIRVLISDHQMPQMSGAEFLSRVRLKRPNMVRILLTGHADMEVVKRAVNDGAIYRFFQKPWDDGELKQAVRQAVEYHSVTRENARLTALTKKQNQQLKEMNSALEKEVELRTDQLKDALCTAQSLNVSLKNSLYQSTRSFFDVIELSRPALGRHCRAVARHSVKIGQSIGLKGETLDNLELAALLHDLAKAGLPEFMLEKAPQDLTDAERKLYLSHPVAAAEELNRIEGLRNLTVHIKAHHERYDGTGFPMGLRTSDIPTEAYIIGIADEYENLINIPGVNREYQYQFAFKTISGYSATRFPPDLVKTALEYIERVNAKQINCYERKVKLASLAPGMILTRDVYTVGGTLLVARGDRLTARKIARTKAISRIDGILGDICVLTQDHSELCKIGPSEERINSGRVTAGGEETK